MRYILLFLILFIIESNAKEKVKSKIFPNFEYYVETRAEVLLKKFNKTVDEHDTLSSIICIEELLSIDKKIFEKENREIGSKYTKILSIYNTIKNDTTFLNTPSKEATPASKSDFFQKKSIYHYSKKEYKKSYNAMYESVKILDKHETELTKNKSITCNNLGVLAEKLGWYNKAVYWYKLSLEISDDFSCLGGFNNKCGNKMYLWDYVGVITENIKYLRISINSKKRDAVYTDKKTGFSKAVDYRTKGVNYIQIEQYQLSLYYLHSAIEIIRDFGNSKELANEYKYLGWAYEEMGDYVNALKYYNKALTMREELFGKEYFYTGTSYADIARVHKLLEEYDKAIVYYQKEMKVRKKTDNMASISYSLDEIGSIYQLKGEYLKALDSYTQALKIRERLSLTVEDSYWRLGNLYKSKKDYNQALNYYKKIENGKRVINPRLYNKLAQVYQALGNYKQALHYMNKSLEYERERFNNRAESVAISKKYSRDLDFKYIFPELYHYEKQLFEKYLQKRDSYFNIYSFKQKESYIKRNREQLYHFLHSAYNYDKDINDTFNLWLQHKGSIFNDENSILTLLDKSSDKWVNEKVIELVSKKRKLAKLYQTYVTEDKIEKWKENIEKSKKEILKLTEKLGSVSTAFKQQQNLKVTYQEISKQLKKDELYIDYAKTIKGYYIFTLDSSSKINFMAIDENSSKEIDNYIKEFRVDIDKISKDVKVANRRNEHSKSTLSKLYNLTIKKPLGNIVKNKNSLIISTDGALRAMPFESMYNSQNQKYLIEQKSIRYISSGQELVRLRRYSKAYENSDRVVIFSNPNFNADISDKRTAHLIKRHDITALFNFDFGALKGSIEEAKQIEKILRIKHTVLSFSQNRANETALLSVNRPKILHLATHGFFIKNNNIPNPMLKSGIVLSGANSNAQEGKDYGVITALKLSGLNLKGTELVVLSACSTGVVDLNSTENISGLSKAFIQAGAKDVVMSLWEVDDMKTMELMSHFYTHIADGNGYSKALKKSKIEMIEAGLHPYFWSAFVLSGL